MHHCLLLYAALVGCLLAGVTPARAAEDAPSTWIPAAGNESITQSGDWSESRFRYAEAASLQSIDDGATLELEFEGTGVAMRLGGHNVPAYGAPNLGMLVVHVDGEEVAAIRPRETPREMVLARGLAPGTHRLRVVYIGDHGNGGGDGCRIEGFRTWSEPCGELQFQLTGEAGAFLVDARLSLSGDPRKPLVRNWMTGQCSLTGLAPGKSHTLFLAAAGWQTAVIPDVKIEAGKATVLPPVHLKRDSSTVISRFRFPALNRPAIHKPGETFRARFLAYDTEIEEVVLTRRIDPATISRTLEFEEDEARAYYYDREIVATLPADMPPGRYDLSVRITGGRRTGFCKSPRSVHVVREFPEDPVFVTFGHLDTSAQYQAEYLEEVARMANLIGADMVLNSNAVNPAYISGALSILDVPYVVNFGNHRFFGHERWFGDPVHRVDFGPGIAILNYGHPWHHGIELADALFSQRPDAKLKIINSFEQNAPLDFLDRLRVAMIHDAHGTGERVMDMGATPTRRVGKTNAISFRVVRFEDGRVATCTYNGHETKPFPFERGEAPPLSVAYSEPNDGSHPRLTASVENRYLDPFPDGRLVLLMPKGDYQVSAGRIESQIDTDADAEGSRVPFTVVTVRVDIPAEASVDVTVSRR